MTWAIILCRFRDVPKETASADFFSNYFTRAGKGTGGMYDYWQDVSGGKLVDQSKVFGWYEIPHDSTEIAGLGRSDFQQWAIDAATANNVALSTYPRRIFFFNANGDQGATGGGNAVFTYAPGRTLEPTFFAHEMGHTLGLDHSFSDEVSGCCSSRTAGEYCDQWDIMSAMCVFRFATASGEAGPGLCAGNLAALGWLDPTRVFSNWGSNGPIDDVELLPLNRADLPGHLAAHIQSPGGQEYYVEFRSPRRWDRGLPYAGVLIHRIEYGHAVLVGMNAGSPRANRPNLDWQVGEEFHETAGEQFGIKVLSIDAARERAVIRVNSQGIGRAALAASNLLLLTP